MRLKILALVSLIVFLLNAGAHAVTFIDGFPISQRHIWPLVVATMVLFLVMLGTLMAHGRSEAARMARMTKEELHQYSYALQKSRPRVFGSVPAWMILLIVGLVLYDVGMWVAHPIGQAVAKEGRFWLVDDEGRQVRQLTVQEYAWFESREVRLFSAQSAVFAFICFTFFTYRHAAPRPPARFYRTRPVDR